MPYFQSLYEILEIAKSASADEIRKAYRKKALETHPDRLSPDASTARRRAAEAQFHLIHNAFDTLGDPQRRKAYDAWGNKLDPNILLEESMKRRQDREAWASGLRAEYERRKVTRRQASLVPSSQHRPESGRTSSAPRPKPAPTPPRQRYAMQNILPDQEQMIEEILQQVRAQLPPDYEERKRRVLEKRTERERAAT